MIRASALYIVIVFALIIGLICSSLITAAYFYKEQNLQKLRYSKLQNNVLSGVNIILADGDSTYYTTKTINPFNNNDDTIAISRQCWGIYDIGVSKAYTQKDTLVKAFTIANSIDSSKWAVLYMNDEERAIGISGKTIIEGNAFLPKAGIKKTYANNRGYEGDERLVQGKIHDSDKKLPVLQMGRLKFLLNYFTTRPPVNTGLPADSLTNSFSNPVKYIYLGKNTVTVKNVSLSGNIILQSDTTLVIDGSAVLNNVIVFAKGIVVESGFTGTCQLFASDSVSIQKNCRFNYPSCIGIINFKPEKISIPSINIGENSLIQGTVFNYVKTEDQIMPVINFGKNIQVTGQVYSQGLLKYNGPFKIAGSIFTRRFSIQQDYSFIENVLLDVNISTAKLSQYYISSSLMPVCTNKKKILQWFIKQ